MVFLWEAESLPANQRFFVGQNIVFSRVGNAQGWGSHQPSHAFQRSPESVASRNKRGFCYPVDGLGFPATRGIS